MQTIASLANWFERSLAGAMQRHGINAARTTRGYLAKMLAHFARTEPLVAGSIGRAVHEPLAVQWAGARAPQGEETRTHRLRNRGDIALFVCGVFPGYVSGRLAGHDYYLSMGRSAYAELAGCSQGAAAATWSELAQGFPDFADAVNAAVWGEDRARDPLTLYERWRAGGSAVARELLEAQDILPVPPQAPHARH